MKISNDIFNNIAKLYKSYPTNQTPADQTEKNSAANAAKSDSVQLSEQARKISELIKEAKDLPEIREEKIARIKEEIANNTYKVSAQQLAAKMLSSENE